MGAISGNDGLLQVFAEDQSYATLAHLTSWTVSVSLDVIETSAMRIHAKTFIPGQYSWTISAEMLYEEDDIGQELINSILLDPYTFRGVVLSSPLTSDTTLTDLLTGSDDTLELQANLTLGDGGPEDVFFEVGLDVGDSISTPFEQTMAVKLYHSSSSGTGEGDYWSGKVVTSSFSHNAALNQPVTVSLNAQGSGALTYENA
tara:strand:+ start:118 stop:723 length:606 start_codon:yes stop_codon:yes gene_type:complete